MTGYGLLHQIVAATPAGGLRIHLRFDDDLEGEVDLGQIIGKFEGLLAPLKDPAYVAQVRLDPVLGTVTWPNGADLDEVVLYCAVRGVSVPTYEEEPKRGAKASPARRGRQSAGRQARSAKRRTGT